MLHQVQSTADAVEVKWWASTSGHGSKDCKECKFGPFWMASSPGLAETTHHLKGIVCKNK